MRTTQTGRTRSIILGLAAGALALVALPATSAVILDTTVTSQFNPYAGSTGTSGNDLPGKPSTLYYGQLKSTAAGRVDFYYIGHEAGYTNTFVYGDSGNLNSGTGSFSTSGQKKFNTPFQSLGSITVDEGAFLDFGFCTSGGSSVGGYGKCAANDDAASLVAQYNFGQGNGYRSIGYVPLTAFDLSGLLQFGSDASGESLLWGLFWDDSGSNNDDNHDDMIIVARFTPFGIVTVPEPATLAIFGLGLLGSTLLMGRRVTQRNR